MTRQFFARMAEVKKQFEQALAFKERFEFRLTVGDDIICQRYFRIGNFNPIFDVIDNPKLIIEKAENLVDEPLLDD